MMAHTLPSNWEVCLSSSILELFIKSTGDSYAVCVVTLCFISTLGKLKTMNETYDPLECLPNTLST